ncbi:DUF6167 family protein [Kitasatospora sp. NBC_01287]|uniref:DUF6167 family protein n=1 Tax=Kitasatospora sp. NBC_01287 TaxID=2903573 RepID=UPI002254CD7F|nr:DUF6167 family protein [Kitasatospora sp. NBC_01287]MCX4745113.1 DUF6167 family protein [Kitasatospora sp. NBC_01287]
MVRRIFWMTVGAGAAVWAMNKANEATRRLTPDSLSGAAARGALHLGDTAKRFALDVRAGMAEREEQLRADLGLDGTAVVEPPRPAARRAIKAAPGRAPVAALPPSRTITPHVIASTPRQLEQRRDKHP